MDSSTIEDYLEDLIEERKVLLARVFHLEDRVRDLSAQLDQCRGVQS